MSTSLFVQAELKLLVNYILSKSAYFRTRLVTGATKHLKFRIPFFGGYYCFDDVLRFEPFVAKSFFFYQKETLHRVFRSFS